MLLRLPVREGRRRLTLAGCFEAVPSTEDAAQRNVMLYRAWVATFAWAVMRRPAGETVWAFNNAIVKGKSSGASEEMHHSVPELLR